ncbi:hypothetical protein SARC_15307 [Sphaeroforma arctica JP610]|uniref:HemN C-terminal domain-containing protein n=1 Tax=Sphaeroforma arctica JP610 TaxID=667725 RepID=A0A0L0F5Z8_9EUKA|nr:hypothetical protein SARC_15307 [Sphaeroforma arctica JP610]KNC72140.1 hypothetical protein SARC_15307 [Sphaeroforma arctica JP610]|eukprot:XP_014146042.1 hypothetical protein SARC_15307 [Sphaeroforma arctica JP610]
MAFLPYISIPTYAQAPAPEQWMSLVEAHGHGTRKRVPQSVTTQLHELIMMGMRTREGIQDSPTWRQLTNGQSPYDHFNARASVQRMQAAGLVVCDLHRATIRPTAAGVAVADSILSEML